MSPGLQQFIAVRRVSAVSPEYRVTSHHRGSTMRPHYARATSVALASCPTTSRIQGLKSCSPVVVRPGTCVPGDDVSLIVDSSRRLLRSASTRTCVVPRTHNGFGELLLFGAAGLRVWNSLPPNLRLDISYEQFKRLLKTFLVDHGAS